MADRYEGINSINLLKSTYIGAGSSGESDIHDIRDLSKNGNFSLSYTISPCGDDATAGSAFFYYKGASYYGGTYVNMGTFGTSAVAAGESNIISFSPQVIPFLKIGATLGTNGSANVTATLHVR